MEIAGVGRCRPGSAKHFGVAGLQPQRRPAARRVALQEPAVGLGVHAELRFQMRNEFAGQRVAPRAVIHRVGKLVRASGAGLIQKHPDHGRHLAIGHGGVDTEHGLYQPARITTKPMGEVHGGVARGGFGIVVRRRQHHGRCSCSCGPHPARLAGNSRRGQARTVQPEKPRRLASG